MRKSSGTYRRVSVALLLGGTLCGLAALAFFDRDALQVAVPSPGTSPIEGQTAERSSTTAVERVQVATEAEPVEAKKTLPQTRRSPSPDEAALPTIDGKPPDESQSRLLRMLAHAMADSGRSFAMPENMTQASWKLLEAVTAPLRTERADLSRRCEKIVSEAVQSRLHAGLYETRRAPPAKWPRTDYVGWRHAKDARGGSIVHLVRIAGGELPEADAMRERSAAIDMDLAALARDFFDRQTR